MSPTIRWSAAMLLATTSLAAWSAPRALVAADSRIAFAVKQMGVEVTGQFERFDAQIDLDTDDPTASTASVTVDIGSLTTGDADADAVALDTPWLNRSAFPQATFTSHAVRRVAQDRFEATGTLAIRGEPRELSERDRWIAAQVGPALREMGLLFVGLDVIGDYLTEINVTSPTCVRELDAGCDLDIGSEVIAAIERRLA
jgi:polyisoprenoid-binding protein YceI